MPLVGVLIRTFGRLSPRWGRFDLQPKLACSVIITERKQKLPVTDGKCHGKRSTVMPLTVTNFFFSSVAENTAPLGKSQLPGARQHPKFRAARAGNLLAGPTIFPFCKLAAQNSIRSPSSQRCNSRRFSRFLFSSLLWNPLLSLFFFPLFHSHAGHPQNRRALGAAQRCPP